MGYGSWRTRVSENTLKSNLTNVAAAMKSARNFSNTYPTTFPSSFTPSTDIVLQMTTAGANEFCINGYHLKSPSTMWSYDSIRGDVQMGHCNGVLTGSPIGGTVPTPPRATNLTATNFTNWTLASGATYSSSVGELTLPAAGVATSPLVRVEKPTSIYTGGDFYATTASPYPTLAPQGGFHINIYYYAADGTTAALNSAGYTANGCAMAFTLNTWDVSDMRCVFSGGPNVIYVKFVIYGSSGGYSSSPLKARSPQLTTT